MEFLLHRIDVAAADAVLERIGQAAFDDLRKAPQFELDGLGLPHEHLEDAVLDALLVDEVVAEDFVFGLELAVDPAVPLLHAAGIPRHVEVEEVPAMGLEVESLARGVGRDEDPDGMLLRVGVEGALDLLALGLGRRAVVDADSPSGAVGRLDGRR